MNDTPLIRGMRASDVDEVVALLGTLFAQERDFTPDALQQRGALERVLAEPNLGCVLVAQRGERVIGSVMLLRSVSTAVGAEVAVLEDLVVEARERGRGTGSALLHAAVRFAETRGWRRITVLTDGDNDRARHLYARHGFTRSDMLVLRRRT